MHCHNSGKQCQILTEFWTNNAMSNCKQITKFKHNLSTPIIVIMGLVRSSQNNGVHYRQSYRHMTVKVYGTSVQISNITKVCVQIVLRMLKCKLKDVDIAA